MLVFIYRRERKSEEKVGKDMELENLKLYKENMSIMEENNKLRKKARPPTPREPRLDVRVDSGWGQIGLSSTLCW
ncbi:hypothetical protein RHGRI_030985 [Rhododendron griersonianum]|uniref:Uncharacterized protein n=1 Tax=Rhododendron griersonianum TaxID=479676 RepID=A0AAV6I6V6_9ERIC|nr:hypothetical protein RHGRI_030985 [Rhododendron griersonianum]